jgi:hypothetical protein
MLVHHLLGNKLVAFGLTLVNDDLVVLAKLDLIVLKRLG